MQFLSGLCLVMILIVEYGGGSVIEVGFQVLEFKSKFGSRKYSSF